MPLTSLSIIKLSIVNSKVSKPITTELLAPARNRETAAAAVDHGADALYMGASRFGARHAAGNSVDDIARTVAYARSYGVRVYATLNTLLFENELEDARHTALELIAAGVDALIVQDMAYLEMGLEGVEFHASTQTFNASPEKVKFLECAGFSRVILERGLSFRQIEAIRAATGVELECFVHGAICVCHSGRCWMSRTMGPRSGNRGECSQPCRLTYDLADPAGRILMKNKHLLSVQDLDLSQRIGDLLDAGITSFKIEGRLKDTAYVKNTVSFYRQRLDAEMARRNGFVRASSGESLHDFTPDPDRTFTRGRSEYFFAGPRRGVASFDTPKAIGSHVGSVTRSGAGWFEFDGDAALSPGDGICFFTEGALTGTNINKTEGRRIFPNRGCDPARGTAVYRNYDHTFTQLLERSRTRRVIDATVQVDFEPECVRLRLKDADGTESTAKLDGPFKPAKDPAAMTSTLKAQIARSGDTIFRITEVEVAEGEVPFIPVSVVNSLRRCGLEQLLAARTNRPPVRNIPQPDDDYPYPSLVADSEENITNSLSEKFYRRHGVENIAFGLDLQNSLVGRRVMRTPYCIRRETGMCLRETPSDPGDLMLIHGVHRYRLEFDCAECMMNVVFEI